MENQDRAKEALDKLEKDYTLPNMLYVIRIAWQLSNDDRVYSQNIYFKKRVELAVEILTAIKNKTRLFTKPPEKVEKSKEKEEKDEEVEPEEEPTPPPLSPDTEDDEEQSTELARRSADIKKRTGEEIEAVEPSGEYIPPQPDDIEILDYYEILGIDPSATQAEIKKARNRELKIHHPDYSELPYEESKKRTRQIYEAYEFLSDEDTRKKYDAKLRKAKNTSEKSPSGTYTYPYEPRTTDEEEHGEIYAALPDLRSKKTEAKEKPKGNLLLSIVVSDEETIDKTLASEKTQEVYDNFKNAGYIDYDQETVDAFVDKVPYIPEGKENDIINAGVFTFMHGVEDERFENAINQADLSNEENLYVQSIKKVNQIMYQEMPEVGDDLRRSSNFQEFEIKRTDQSEPSPLSIMITEGKDIVVGKLKEGAQKVTEEVKKRAVKATKKLVKKAVKKFSEKAAKSGLKRAFAAVASTLGEFFGGPVGQAILYAAIEVAGKIIGKVWGVIKRFIPESIRKHSKEIAAAGIVVTGAGLLGGSVGTVVLGGSIILVGGLGTAAGVGGTALAAITLLLAAVTAAVANFLFWILIIVFGVLFLTLIILYIITTGAYVVPYSPTSLTTGQDVQIGGTLNSPYMDVVKTASPETEYDREEVLDGNSVTVTYTISINSLSGTLSNIRLEYDCNIFKEGNPPDCPPIQLVDPPEGTEPNEFPEMPETINEGEPYVFSYTQTYQGEDFVDTFITDTVTVTADADEQANTMESAGAFITIGEPPLSCIEFTNTFPASERNALVGAAMYLTANYPAYMEKVCRNGPIVQCYNPSDATCVGCWGAHRHNPYPLCDIEWFNGDEWRGSFENTAFIAAHEWMHHVQATIPEIQTNYELSGALVEGDICSYPDWIYIEGTPDIENLAEATGVYVFEPTHWDLRCSGSFVDLYPLHWQYVHDNVMN